MTSITQLICEYLENPLGIDIIRPRLSWRMQTERQGAHQTAYQVLAASHPDLLSSEKADLWNSGKIEGEQSIHIVYGGKTLTSRQRVYWSVTVWDENGDSSQSEIAWFEMGLLDRSDWQALWIGGSLVGAPRSTIPTPYLRKSFSINGTIQSARLYVTALGLYEGYINGQIIGDDVLNPGWTDFNKRVRYRVYDVTETLQSGDNAIGIILGDGWATGHIGMGNRQNYVERPRLLAQLEITLSDGSTQNIVSDNSWKHQFGALVENDLIMGESYDARLEIPGWDSAGFDDSSWLPVTVFEDTGTALVATNSPTIKRIEELKPISDPVDKGNFIQSRYIFDMGQNMVGWVRFKGTAPRGTTIILRFAEVQNSDGTLYTENLRAARATDNYTFKGDGEEVFEPKFTFHGFRYVEVSGYRGEVSRDTVTGIVLHSDMKPTGTFECSEPILNQLQHNIQWGQKGNFVDVPTDCPQRDERLGWTGDIQVFARTAAFNFDVAGFMTKWAQDVADSQSESGSVPAVVPIAIGLMDGGPAWADAAIICPWTIYLSYGDKRILEENYTVMTRFMDFLIRESPNYIRCAPDYTGWHGFGDWLSINADTPRDLIGTAFFAYDATLMAQISEVIGKPDDARKYRALSEDVTTAFQNRYLKGGNVSIDEIVTSEQRRMIEGADGISRGNLQKVDYGPIESEVFNTDLFTPTQTAYILALHFDLLPEAMQSTAVNELVIDIERRDMHLSAGFVGSPYLPHVLSKFGRLDVAYQLLHQKTWPSWLYSVTQGATTIWERWDGWTEDRGFQDPGMNSFNHYAYGAIGAWLYNTVAGLEIDPSKPGYKHFLIQPQVGGGLTSAKASLDTLYGQLLSDWRIENGTFHLTVLVPPNTSATIILPDTDNQSISLNGSAVRDISHEVNAGNYVFVMK